jgi:ADP-ribose pyrophosphatase YjhB (NUDIX family)
LGLFQPIHRDSDRRVRYHFLVIDFLAYYRSGDLRVGDDAADARWVAPADLPQYELNEATREMIARALERLKIAS